MKRLPVCFGTHEAGHPACDGVRLKAAPCAVRDRCIALRLHCRKVGKRRQDFLHYFRKSANFEYALPVDGLVEDLNEIVLVNGIRDGKVAGRPPGPRKAVHVGGRPPREIERSREAKQAAREGARQKARSDAQAALSLAMWFVYHLAKLSGRNVAETPGSADVGDLFMEQRVRYWVLRYRRTPTTMGIVAFIYLRPRKAKLEVRLTVEHSQMLRTLSVEDKRLLTFENIAGKASNMLCQFRHLDRALASRVAERIAQAIELGIIHLPAQLA